MVSITQNSSQRLRPEENRVYKAARQSMRDLDRDLPDILKGAADARVQALRAWIPFRDATKGFSFAAAVSNLL
ncbi:hypothetical protein [Pseudophaeobacter sp.]|uniref:hypothetical protein n=1 Tax=Pseudophaeobacter sp. TaxID=1971739 RepID=UPI00329888EA